MAHYAVYLELDPAGACRAHVPELPGCCVRASSQAEALAALADEVRAYHAWRRARGEDVPGDDTPLTFAVAETHFAEPFGTGSPAALLAADRAPLSRPELDRYLRLAADTRADLLALVRDLPDEVLDWPPPAGEMSIRDILQHIGATERSLEAPGPPVAASADDVFTFLERQRAAALAQLQALAGAGAAAAAAPGPRTARQGLRHLLEHEREHTRQVRDVLAAWRRDLLAAMARERAALLAEMLNLDPATLTQVPVAADWTCKDLLAHVAAWDEFMTARIELVLAGREEEIAGVDSRERNSELYPERKKWSLEQALAAAYDARRALLDALARVSDEELHRTRSFAWGQASVRRWAVLRYVHDAEHRLELEAWCQAIDPPEAVSPRPLLLAALRASRDELLAHAARVPAAERDTRLVAGEWTLKDVCGHVADWETQCTHAIRDMLAGRSPEVAFVDDEEIWNRAQAEMRRAQPWDQVWHDLHAARAELVAVIEAATLADLARILPSYWTDNDSAYAWARFCVTHERSHTALLA